MKKKTISKQDFCTANNLSEAQFNGTEKVVGYLDLSSVTAIPDGFNPTVGGSLDLSSGSKYIGSNIPTSVTNPSLFWKNSYKKKYAKIDGMFCEVINERVKKMVILLLRFTSAKRLHRLIRFTL